MNFKFTLFKTIISILGGIIIFFYLAGGVKCDSPDGCIKAIWIYPLYSTIPIVIFIFILWSIFEKKK
jgi:hypothetical protein